MKKILVLFLIIFFMENCFGAVIFSQSNKYGLKDEDGKILLNPKYDEIKKLCYSPQKTILIPMKATQATETIESDYFRTKINNKYGIINTDGKILYDNRFDDIKLNDYGEIILVQNEEETIASPVKNSFKKAQKTLESLVGLPVTIVAGVMIPIEVISKIGRK